MMFCVLHVKCSSVSSLITKTSNNTKPDLSGESSVVCVWAERLKLQETRPQNIHAVKTKTLFLSVLWSDARLCVSVFAGKTSSWWSTVLLFLFTILKTLPNRWVQNFLISYISADGGKKTKTRWASRLPRQPVTSETTGTWRPMRSSTPKQRLITEIQSLLFFFFVGG